MNDIRAGCISKTKHYLKKKNSAACNAAYSSELGLLISGAGIFRYSLYYLRVIWYCWSCFQGFARSFTFEHFAERKRRKSLGLWRATEGGVGGAVSVASQPFKFAGSMGYNVGGMLLGELGYTMPGTQLENDPSMVTCSSAHCNPKQVFRFFKLCHIWF